MMTADAEYEVVIFDVHAEVLAAGISRKMIGTCRESLSDDILLL